MDQTAPPLAQISKANPGKIIRWTADRIHQARTSVAWRARHLRFLVYEAFPLHGKLPPGSLSTSCGRDAHLDDHFYLKQQRRYGPIFKLFWGSGDLKVCIIGYPLARRLLGQHSGSLHPVTLDISSLVPAEYLRGMSPTIHPRYRSLFMGALRNELVASWEPEIRRLVRDELVGMTEAKPGTPAPARLYSALDRIATRTLFQVILGVRPDGRMFTALETAYHRLGPDGYAAPVGRAQKAAFRDIREVVLQIVDLLCRGGRGEFGASVISHLVSAGRPGVDDTVIGNIIYMIERGRHDLRDLMRWIIKELSDSPSVVRDLRLAVNTAHTFSRLAEACVLETLRLNQAEQIVRRALKPFSLEGHYIPKGSLITVMMRETHRDPEIFPEPDTFRPRRFVERTFSNDEYSPFGIDQHQCIGRTLNLRVGTILVQELVAGYTWSVINDGPRCFGQYHWQPSPAFAIDVRRITQQKTRARSDPAGSCAQFLGTANSTKQVSLPVSRSQSDDPL
jgi:cytochrome P450 family 110